MFSDLSTTTALRHDFARKAAPEEAASTARPGAAWTDLDVARRRTARGLDTFGALALSVFWAGFIAIFTMRSLLMGSDPLENMLPRVLIAVYGALLSWSMFRILDRLSPRTIGMAMGYAIAVSVPASILFSVGHELIFTPLADITGAHCEFLVWRHCPQPRTWNAIVDSAVNYTFLFSAWGLVQLAARSTLERWAADNRAGEQREAARIAQLRALHNQVNPHFLFNCLNSLNTLVDRGDASAARGMIGEMGSFLRYGLSIDPLLDIDLEDEIEMQRRYLEIERYRFAHRLTVEVEVDRGLRRARVPPLLMQPLVENAVKHGVASTSAPVAVLIAVRRLDGDRMEISVEDDAPLVRSEMEPGRGVGLRNVDQRLHARFDGLASLEAGPRVGGGFRAVMTMPIVRGGKSADVG